MKPSTRRIKPQKVHRLESSLEQESVVGKVHKQPVTIWFKNLGFTTGVSVSQATMNRCFQERSYNRHILNIKPLLNQRCEKLLTWGKEKKEKKKRTRVLFTGSKIPLSNKSKFWFDLEIQDLECGGRVQETRVEDHSSLNCPQSDYLRCLQMAGRLPGSCRASSCWRALWKYPFLFSSSP